MSDDGESAPKPKPRMALRRRQDAVPEVEPQPDSIPCKEEVPEPPAARVQLRKKADMAEPVALRAEPEITVNDLLDEANRPHLRLERRARWIRRVLHTVVFLGLTGIFAAGSYFYAHHSKQWPPLEQQAFYLPFILSLLLASLLCLNAFSVIREFRRYYLGIFNIVLAMALLAFNLRVLEISSQQRNWSPWLESSPFGVMLAHELLTALQPQHPADFGDWFDPNRMSMDLAQLPKTHWRPIFQKYLSPEEMADVNYLNIDDYLPVVVRRVHGDPDSVWAHTAQAYRDNDYRCYMVRIAAAPYSATFRWLR